MVAEMVIVRAVGRAECCQRRRSGTRISSKKHDSHSDDDGDTDGSDKNT